MVAATITEVHLVLGEAGWTYTMSDTITNRMRRLWTGVVKKPHVAQNKAVTPATTPTRKEMTSAIKPMVMTTATMTEATMLIRMTATVMMITTAPRNLTLTAGERKMSLRMCPVDFGADWSADDRCSQLFDVREVIRTQTDAATLPMIFGVSNDASCSILRKRGETSLKLVGNTKEVPARVTARVALELVGGSSGSDAEEPADSSESGHDEVTTRFGMWSSTTALRGKRRRTTDTMMTEMWGERHAVEGSHRCGRVADQ